MGKFRSALVLSLGLMGCSFVLLQQEGAADPAGAAATLAEAQNDERPAREPVSARQVPLVVPIAEPPPITAPPKLLVTEAGEERPMIVERVNTEVVIRGQLAETTTTMLFRNPHERVLEGELDFPLPEGASISGFGLDVEGQLVDGVIVAKDEARVAFETEVRRGVDPGLAEWVRGNNFRTRVYPIPAGGTREIRVSYVHSLSGTAEESQYLLPMRHEHAIPEFSLRVEVVQGEVAPVVQEGPEGLEFSSWEDRWVTEHASENADLNWDLKLVIPNRKAQRVHVETDGQDHVFVVHDTITHTLEPEESWQPERALVYWDASLSRKGQMERDLEALQAMGENWPSLELDLVVLRDRPEPVESLSGFDALQAHLQELVYDGGTDLSGLEFPGEGTRGAYDLHLVFSDGMGNVGERPSALPTVPVFTVGSTSDANHLFLRDLSEGSGGAHLNLASQSVGDAVAAIGPDPYAFLGIEVLSGEVSEVYPNRRVPVVPRFNVSGRLDSEAAEIVLLYGRAGEVHRRVPVRLSSEGASSTGLVPRFWAQQKVNRLSAAANPDKKALLELGRRYGLVTPGASFLVLETLAQHIEHGVRPPDSRDALLKAWQAHQENKSRQEAEKEVSKVEEVVALWEKRVAWWEREVPKVTEVDSNTAEEGGELARAEEGRGHGGGRVRRRAAEAQRSRPTGNADAGEGARSPELQFESLEMEDAVEMHGMMGAQGALSHNPSAPVLHEAGEGAAASITVSAWDPTTPYMAVLKDADSLEKAYEAYVMQRAGYGSNPAYFLDCASYFFAQGRPELGRRVLTSVLDLELDNPALLRVVAYRLAETKDLDLAVRLLRAVLELRPEEPQSHRDLALMLARRAESLEAEQAGPEQLADFNEAMDLLHQVVMGDWQRFPEIEVIALMELNRLLAITEALPSGLQEDISRPELDPRLVRLLEVDVRISLSWDADLTDIDLWVLEPTGEKAFYRNTRTRIGGLVSKDYTQGYGPEEYLLKSAVSGEYTIQANYYGSSAQTLIGPATVKAVVITNWGRADEERQEITLRLGAVKEAVTVAKVSF